jgi:hypothetical protein
VPRHVASCLHKEKLEDVLYLRQFDVSIAQWRPGFNSPEIYMGFYDFPM